MTLIVVAYIAIWLATAVLFAAAGPQSSRYASGGPEFDDALLGLIIGLIWPLALVAWAVKQVATQVWRAS